ncbi:MAG: hypothetical protein KY454_03095 [Actinobacteria bacterium]|nr:hypothetical protein [Actinomycetota bacterium]MBW3650025.1 hypothetical protein [Actinomycetota bacterium]
MGLVVALGVAGIVTSRQQRHSELASSKDLAPPAVGRDHWHAAYGIYLCNEFAPAPTDDRDPKGIHTHGDGVIHIHPTVRSAAGANATLGVYADAIRMRLTDDEIRLPGGKSYKEGSTKCDGKAGIVQVRVDGDKVVTENVRDIKFTDRQLLTIAFAPKGAELPLPPSQGQLDNLTDVAPSTTLPVIPPEGSDTTDEGAATTAPPDDTSTTAP